MSALLSFQFKQESVRIVVVEDEPWFVAADLCGILGLSNVTMALRRLDDDQVTLNRIEGASNGKPVNCVSESGMWMLVLRSDKPEAVELRRWLSRDVLPSIRKTGRYEVPGFDPPPMQASDLDPTRMSAGVAVVREARRLFGPGAARTLWAQVGLPPVTPDSEGLNDADPLAEPLRAYLCGRAETTMQEAAEGIGIQHPDHSTRHRLGRLMAMWGWVNHTRKIGKKATRVYSRPAAQVVIEGEIA